MAPAKYGEAYLYTETDQFQRAAPSGLGPMGDSTQASVAPTALGRPGL
jgi:hypothetical protein